MAEGVERPFHANQLLIASDSFEARAATIGAPPEAYLEWADASPVPLSTVAEELGVLTATPKLEEAAHELAALGPEQTERAGRPLFFRTAEQRPAALRGTSAALHSQQSPVAGLLRPAHLLDLIRNFTVFQQVDGKTRKVLARYQQFRAIHKAITRLAEDEREARGDPAALLRTTGTPSSASCASSSRNCAGATAMSSPTSIHGRRCRSSACCSKGVAKGGNSWTPSEVLSSPRRWTSSNASGRRSARSDSGRTRPCGSC